MVEAAEEASGQPPWWDAEVVGHERRTIDTAVLWLRPEPEFPYEAGQSVPNSTVVELSPSGSICLSSYAQAGNVSPILGSMRTIQSTYGKPVMHVQRAAAAVRVAQDAEPVGVVVGGVAAQ